MALLGLALLLAACSGAKHRNEQLTITGSSTMAPLVGEIAKRFEKIEPGTRVDVQMGGSSRGILDARMGLAGLGMVSRSLDPGEEDLHGFPLARDGVCIIVNKRNPVAELREKEILAIYRGRIRNWREIGGKDAPITVVNKAEGRATLEVFLHYFHLENSEIRADVVIGDNEQGIKTVAGNRDAIGYVSIGTAEYDAARGIAIKLLPLDGVQATAENVGSGAFPLSRTLNIVSKDEPVGLAKRFLAFARSDKVHDLIRKEGFVPLAH